MKTYRLEYDEVTAGLVEEDDPYLPDFTVAIPKGDGFHTDVRLMELDTDAEGYDPDYSAYYWEPIDVESVDGPDCTDPEPYEKAEDAILARNGLTREDITSIITSW